MKRSITLIAAISMLLATAAFAQTDTSSAPKGWTRLAKAWIPAIQNEGTYDPEYPDSVPPKLVNTLLALQSEGIGPDYLKRIDREGKTLTNVVFWAVQGQDAAKIREKVLATPGAIKTPPRSARKPAKKH